MNISPFKIATLNAYGGRITGVETQTDNFVDFIVEEVSKDNDVVGLFEVHRTEDITAQRFINMRNPGHGNFPIDTHLENRLRARLSKTHALWYQPHFDTTCRGYHDYEKTSLPIDFGNLLIIKKSVALHSKPTIHTLYGNGLISTEKSHSGQPATRKALVVTVMVNDSPVTILTVHGLHSKRFGKTDCPPRLAQSNYIAQAIVRHQRNRKLHLIEGGTTKTLIMGDLNKTSEMEATRLLLAKIEAFGGDYGVNLNTVYGYTNTRNLIFYPRNKPTFEANFAFVSKAVLDRVMDYRVISRVPSDHALLELTIS